MDSLVRSAQPVQAVEVDARCAVCRSYVHRYLDRCPICGDGRSSAFRRALDEWQAFAVADSPPVAEGDLAEKPPLSPALAAARDQSVQAFAEAEARFRRAGQLVLRYEGGLPGIPSGHDVNLTLVNRQLEVRDVPAGRLLATFDPSDVLAAIPSAGRGAAADAWSNVLTSGAAPSGSVATWGGAFTVVFVRDGAGVQFGLANRPGFFTKKARADYFVGLAREFADLCDAAARNRELVDGPIRYAHAIGLRAAHVDATRSGGLGADWPSSAGGSASAGGASSAGGSPAATPAPGASSAVPGTSSRDVTPAAGSAGTADAPRAVTASPPAAGDRTLAELLEQLEVAFRAGLITAAERDSKREEILRRF